MGIESEWSTLAGCNQSIGSNKNWFNSNDANEQKLPRLSHQQRPKNQKMNRS